MLKIVIQNKFQFRMIPDFLLFGLRRNTLHRRCRNTTCTIDSIREAEVINGLGTDRDGEMKAILVEHNLAGGI